MRKVYVGPGETVVNVKYLHEMERRAQAEEAYRRATEYMTGYMMETREQMHDAMDSDHQSSSLWEARMRGRIEAITKFDEAVVQFASES